jgi:hypothetical protein
MPSFDRPPHWRDSASFPVERFHDEVCVACCGAWFIVNVFGLYQSVFADRTIPPDERLRGAEKLPSIVKCVKLQKEIWFSEFSHRSFRLWALRTTTSKYDAALHAAVS